MVIKLGACRNRLERISLSYTVACGRPRLVRQFIIACIIYLNASRPLEYLHAIRERRPLRYATPHQPRKRRRMKRTAAWASPALFIVCSLISLVSAKDWIREPGRCSMIDSCVRSSQASTLRESHSASILETEMRSLLFLPIVQGRKGGIFGQSLPCASNEPARPIDASLRASLESVCGVATTEAWERSCCTSDQLETLQANLQQAEPLLALCPACKLNFRDFFCSFTCHPDQSTFVSVVETQNLNSRSTAATAEEIEAWITAREEAEISTVQQQQGPAVKRIAFHVDEQFGRGFFDSCKNVKFGATNGYAMDLIGGGAKDWLGFVNYMGTEVID